MSSDSVGISRLSEEYGRVSVQCYPTKRVFPRYGRFQDSRHAISLQRAKLLVGSGQPRTASLRSTNSALQGQPYASPDYSSWTTPMTRHNSRIINSRIRNTHRFLSFRLQSQAKSTLSRSRRIAFASGRRRRRPVTQEKGDWNTEYEYHI